LHFVGKRLELGRDPIVGHAAEQQMQWRLRRASTATMMAAAARTGSPGCWPL
jgi:hypothetical protein